MLLGHDFACHAGYGNFAEPNWKVPMPQWIVSRIRNVSNVRAMPHFPEAGDTAVGVGEGLG